MISIAHTLIHPGRGSPASVSPLMSFMSTVRMTSAAVSSLEENCLSMRKTTWVLRRASGKAGHSERFEKQGGDWMGKGEGHTLRKSSWQFMGMLSISLRANVLWREL